MPELQPQDQSDGFRIIHISFLITLLESVVCGKCKYGRMTVKENMERKMGFASSFTFECSACASGCEMYTSPHCEDSRSYEVNRRMVLGLLEIGGGKSSLETLCSILNMPKAMSDDAYLDTVRKVKEALEKEASFSMEKAAHEEHGILGSPLNQIVECKAMFDGTWRKRGHSSLQGVVTAISAETGRCLDYETLNKVCFSCARWNRKESDAAKDNWLAQHKCPINFSGSAPAMEPEGVKRIFARSEDSRKLQYTGYIGDGDSKSFSSIKASNPYANKDILKYECVGHVQKRMGTALRKLKAQKGKQKLKDGKTIGGLGRLTNAKIDKLQVYYGLAIRRHKHDLEGMKKEVWAGLCHSASSDENPQHQNCPKGPNTWCKYNLALLEKKPYKHPCPLPSAIADELQPIYERLTTDDIMQGCLGGYTQNSCEALNHLIWARCPKSKHSGRDHIDAAVAGAVIAFNDGNSGVANVLKHLGINPGNNMVSAIFKRDCKRKRESKTNATTLAQKVRKSRRKARKTTEDSNIAQEGVMYEAGAF